MKRGENYLPWQVNVKDFYEQSSETDRLKFLIRFAILAPSSHNSQPWNFKLEENHISIFANLSRCLPFSDSNERQLYISLGCAIKNIIVAADYFGYTFSIDYAPDNHCAAIINFSEGIAHRDEKHLIFSILTRANNRSPYTEQLPPSNFFEKIKSFANAETQIDILTEKTKKDSIAKIAIDAGIAAMDDPGFRSELSAYVKNNLTASKLGMPMFGFGMPTPISLAAPLLVKQFNMNRATRKKDLKLLVEQTPAVIVISTKNDAKKDWLKVGGVFEEIALLAEQGGIKTGVLAAPIQIGKFFEQIQTILSSMFRPQMFFRIGYSQEIPHHSPRLLDNEVMI